MRQGYRPLLEALEFMNKNRKVDCSRSLGGAMEAGIHTAKVVEYTNGIGYVDYILIDKDGNSHKERIFSDRIWKPGPDSVWQFELHYAGDGYHHIERGGDTYYLINGNEGKVVQESDSIRELYTYLRGHSLKLKYLRMKWRREII